MSKIFPDWLQRLCNEEAELSGRVTKLRAFLCNEKGPSADRIDDDEHRDLVGQLSVMLSYQHILQRRIERNSAKV